MWTLRSGSNLGGAAIAVLAPYAFCRGRVRRPSSTQRRAWRSPFDYETRRPRASRPARAERHRCLSGYNASSRLNDRSGGALASVRRAAARTPPSWPTRPSQRSRRPVLGRRAEASASRRSKWASTSVGRRVRTARRALRVRHVADDRTRPLEVRRRPDMPLVASTPDLSQGSSAAYRCPRSNGRFEGGSVVRDERARDIASLRRPGQSQRCPVEFLPVDHVSVSPDSPTRTRPARRSRSRIGRRPPSPSRRGSSAPARESSRQAIETERFLSL